MPLFALYLGATPEIIGITVGVSTVTGIFFKLPSGALSDVIGRRRTMLVGLVFFAVMPFTYLLVSDYKILIIIRFFHGFATAVYGPVAMAVVAEIAGARRGEMMSWFSSVTIIGNLLGAPIGGLMLHGLVTKTAPVLWDYQMVYLGSGIAGVLALLIFLQLVKAEKTIGKGSSLKESFERFYEGIKEVASDRRILITANMEGLQNMSVGTLEAFLPIYAVTVAGLSELQAGLLWGVQILATILSKPMIGKVSDRSGRRPLIAIGMALCAVSFALMPHLKSFYALMCAGVIFGFGEAFVTSSSSALVADVCKEKHFGTAMGTFGTIFDIGHASGPIASGFLIARLDYGYSFAVIAGLMMLSIPLFLRYVKTELPEIVIP